MNIRALARTGDATLPAILAERARRHPDRLAFREKDLGLWKRIRWGEYAHTVRCFAIGLQALGFGPGDRLAIASEATPEWMYADLAAQALGGVCVGLYPTSPWREIAFVLDHCAARVVVCGDQEQTDKVFDALAAGALSDLDKIVCVDPKGMRGYSDPRLLFFDDVVETGRKRLRDEEEAAERAFAEGIRALKPDDPAIIVYTSGTTGHPKGAMLSHRNLLVAAAAVLDAHGYTESNHSTVCYLPLCHVAERSFSTVMQLCCGSVVNFAESTDTVANDLREIAPTVFLGVPRIWEKLQHAMMIRLKESYRINQLIIKTALDRATPIKRRQLEAGGSVGLLDRLLLRLLQAVVFRNLRRYTGLHRARSCFCGAASISPEVLLFFQTIGLPIYQVYGMTETAAVAFQQKPGTTAFGCVGEPIPSLEHRLGADGELLMCGPSVFLGYLDAPDATAAAFQDGWLASGDIAENVGGEIRIVDRKKDLIVTSGGKNIAPSEVENALKESPYIREAVVVGEGRKFVGALIQIDYDVTAKWAQARNLSFTTFRSLTELPDVRELIAREVEAANQRFARVSQVRKHHLLSKELDHDDGELTATMKVRRKAIEARFADEIALLYGEVA